MPENKTEYQIERDFLAANNIDYSDLVANGNTCINVDELLSKFTQHLIDTGEVIRPVTVIDIVSKSLEEDKAKKVISDEDIAAHALLWVISEYGDDFTNENPEGCALIMEAYIAGSSAKWMQEQLNKRP